MEKSNFAECAKMFGKLRKFARENNVILITAQQPRNSGNGHVHQQESGGPDILIIDHENLMVKENDY